MKNTDLFMKWLFGLCRPLLGEWLKPAGSVLSYVNAFAQVYYFFLNYWFCHTATLDQVIGIGFWIPVIILVVLSGIYFKNFHQFIGFFIALVFLLANVFVLFLRIDRSP